MASPSQPSSSTHFDSSVKILETHLLILNPPTPLAIIYPDPLEVQKPESPLVESFALAAKFRALEEVKAATEAKEEARQERCERRSMIEDWEMHDMEGVPNPSSSDPDSDAYGTRSD
ncbi:hypothetical protein FCV25MIE_29666 [Fagus crenata]